MTITDNWDYSCHKCGYSNSFTIYKLIDSSSDPFIKEKILDGSIFSFTCSNCLTEFPRIYDLVFHNPEKKFVVCFFSQGTDNKCDDDTLKMLEEEGNDTGMYYLRFPFITNDWAEFKLVVKNYTREMTLEEFQKKQYEEIAKKTPVEFFTLASREQKFWRHSSFIYFSKSMNARYGIADVVINKRRQEIDNVLKDLKNMDDLGELFTTLNSEASCRTSDMEIDEGNRIQDFYKLTEEENPWGGEVYYLGMNKHRKITGTSLKSKLEKFNVLRLLNEGEYTGTLQPDFSIEGITLLRYPIKLNSDTKCFFRARVIEDKFDVFGNNRKISFYDCCEGCLLCEMNLGEDDETQRVYSYECNHRYFQKCGYLIDWAIDFMFRTYVLNQETPCPVLPSMVNDPDAMSKFAFSLFGRKAIYGKVYEKAFEIKF